MFTAMRNPSAAPVSKPLQRTDGRHRVFRLAEPVIACVAIALGILAAIRLLDRGIFFDEFFTLAMTEPSLTASEFFGYLSLDIHPALHFLMIWGERLLGIDGVTALRATNLIGAPLVIWALWFSAKQRSLTITQVWLIAALCATSTAFLDEFAEMRPYYLAICAATAMVLVWRILHLRLLGDQRISGGLLLAWTAPLALLANLNYFGMLLGGFFTAALLLEALFRRRGAAFAQITILSLLAAAPALALLSIQIHHQPENFWITTTTFQAAELFVQFGRALVLNNLVLFALAATTLLLVPQSAEARREHWTSLCMLMVLASFACTLMALNAVKPMLTPRYLTTMAPALIVAGVMLATGSRSLRWAPIAILLAAVLSMVEGIVTNKHARDGWNVSAARVAEMAALCPTTRVFFSTYLGEGDYYTLDSAARRIGHLHFEGAVGRPLHELTHGDAVPVDGACPSIVWLEHTFEDQQRRLDANAVLQLHGLQAAANARLEYVSSGAIVTVAPLER